MFSEGRRNHYYLISEVQRTELANSKNRLAKNIETISFVIRCMVCHDHFHAKNPGEGRNERGADRLDVNYLGTNAKSCIEKAYQSIRDCLQTFARDMSESDDTDTFVLASWVRTIGLASNHCELVLRTSFLQFRDEVLAVTLNAPDDVRNSS